MKKKAIEKVPYLTLPKVNRKKKVKYIGVTAFKVIAHERHLFLEVYRNNKACKNVPVVRIVLNKKDFGTYIPESGAWSRGRITRNTWNNYGLIWRENDERIRKSSDVMIEENILYSREDLERIKKFTNETLWREEAWWEFIDIWQGKLIHSENAERSRRKYERRQQALEERERLTPELPKSRILEYADTVVFHNLHYLYYKKHGVRATVACSKCGGVSDERWKPGISYESNFERTIQEPKMGDFGICPMCGARGEYMPQGRAKGVYRQTSHLFLGQRYKEGMVFRYIEIGKEWQLGLICGERGPEMYNCREQLDGIEIARAYFEPGKKTQVDFNKHNPWTGRDFWDDCNLSGAEKITIQKARVMPETYQNMKGTFLQYSAMEEYQKAEVIVNPVDYMERYIQTPQIEMLVKLKLFGVVQKLLKYEYGIVENIEAKHLDEFLGIRKDKAKQLIKHKGDISYLYIMQTERRLDQHWTWEQVDALQEMRAGVDSISTAIQYMTVQKLINRVAEYAGCGFGTNCSTAVARLRQTAGLYFDYLSMRQELGYDLHNTVYQHPRSLEAAHNKMILEQNSAEQEKRCREVAEKYQNIRKQYRKLRKRYYYEDDTFLIRPARSAEEIVKEGMILHHCVGGDNYLRKHNEQESIILVLRYKQEPETPYVTVEIKEEKILQWYGAYDKKPDKDNLKRWLSAYVTRLKRQAPKAEEEERQRISVSA